MSILYNPDPTDPPKKKVDKYGYGTPEVEQLWFDETNSINEDLFDRWDKDFDVNNDGRVTSLEEARGTKKRAKVLYGPVVDKFKAIIKDKIAGGAKKEDYDGALSLLGKADSAYMLGDNGEPTLTTRFIPDSDPFLKSLTQRILKFTPEESSNILDENWGDTNIWNVAGKIRRAKPASMSWGEGYHIFKKIKEYNNAGYSFRIGGKLDK